MHGISFLPVEPLVVPSEQMGFGILALPIGKSKFLNRVLKMS